MFCCHSNYKLLQVKEAMILIDGNVINDDNKYWIFRQGYYNYVMMIIFKFIVLCSPRSWLL